MGRKRAKRTKPPRHRGQRRQKLSKAARELYPAAGDDGDTPAAEGWEEELNRALDPRPRTSRRRSSPEVPPEATSQDVRRGVVLSPSSAACRIEAEGRVFDCALPSRIARDQQRDLAVGDEVSFAAHGAGHRVLEVLPRRTTLSRPDPRNPMRERVIAANIDVVVQVVSTRQPPLRPALIDRCRIAIERGGATGLLCVNKIDLLSSEAQRRRLEARLKPYRDLGLEVVACSTATGEGVAEIASQLAGRTAVLVGHSGVGKSSLLNALSPESSAATATVGRRDGRGRHTTTRSRLYRLAGGARVIDTPGIREFGLFELDARELSAYFPEIARFAPGCRFNDCHHLREPQCAVRAAVTAGEIPAARLEIYLRILESLTTG